MANTPIRVITLDVTGTLAKFKGHIGDIYCSSAMRAANIKPDYDKVHKGFKDAYIETSKMYPCFGGSKMETKEWWRRCVKRSFDIAGYHFKPQVQENIFRHIYALFGSRGAYEAFDDSKPFIEWAKGEGLIVGVVSNADERYEDGILPMLDLYDRLDFVILSKLEEVEKPDPEIFVRTIDYVNQWLKMSGFRDNVKMEEVVHIGDNYKKDYLMAKSLGARSILLDRFNTEEAKQWRRDGAEVMRDFTEVQEWLQHRRFLIRPSQFKHEDRLCSLFANPTKFPC
mmetsp:Transcript_37077/g.51458  ORF Transcript_37077/g.51458 Transcript_37077/m.51458 type:complete len:283 (-) Transcript_37077:182-1030(-)